MRHGAIVARCAPHLSLQTPALKQQPGPRSTHGASTPAAAVLPGSPPTKIGSVCGCVVWPAVASRCAGSAALHGAATTPKCDPTGEGGEGGAGGRVAAATQATDTSAAAAAAPLQQPGRRLAALSGHLSPRPRPSTAAGTGGRDVLIYDSEVGRMAVVDGAGEIAWQQPAGSNIHDFQLLPNGNILTLMVRLSLSRGPTPPTFTPRVGSARSRSRSSSR